MTLKLIPLRVPEKTYRALKKRMRDSGDIHLSTYLRRVLTDYLKEENANEKNNRTD